MPTEQPSGIVTPEAVLLEFETAGVSSRAVAKFLDLLIIGTVWFAVAMVISFVAITPGAGQTIAVVLTLLSFFLLFFGYPIALEATWNGRTVGKAALGLRVVTREGSPVRFRHSFLRGIVGFFETLFPFPFISILSAGLSPRNQRVGDLAAGTLVLRERTGDRSAVSVTFPPPPGFEAYVASLDITGVDAEQYAVIRSFLMRVLEFTPGARATLAWKLANPVALTMHHTPPPALSPELFLVCVASAYQLRHGGPASSLSFGPPRPPPASAWVPPVAGYP